MMSSPAHPHHSRRDTLRLGAAAGLAVTAGASLARSTSAQTPVAEGGISTTVHAVSLAAAQRILEAAQAKAEELGRPVVLAIVDAGGLLKAFHRMDGVVSAPPVEIAQLKAYTAASFRTPTHEVAETNLENPARMASLPNLPRVTLLAGGYPILDGEVVVGGIGVSGATPEQDMEIAEAGLAALEA